MSTDSGPRRRISLGAWIIASAALPIHAALAVATELSPDEAYYFCAARQPNWTTALRDHPPLLVALLRATRNLVRLPIEVRVRLWPIALSFATTIACVRLAAQRGATPREQTLAAALTTFAILPMAGGFVATPDAPALLAFVVLLVWATSLARSSAGGLALAAGAAFAGSLAKVVLLPLALTIALFADRRGRAERLTVAAAAIAAVPFAATSLSFQIRHAFVQHPVAGWRLVDALAAIATAAFAQALLWSPWVLARGASAIASDANARPERAVTALLTALVALSAIARALPPEPNWYAPAAVVLAIAAARGSAALRPIARAGLVATVAIPAAIAALHAAHPILPIPPDLDPTARLHGWRDGPEPTNAPGVGRYGPAAEHCAYRDACDEIDLYFQLIERDPESGSRSNPFR